MGSHEIPAVKVTYETETWHSDQWSDIIVSLLVSSKEAEEASSDDTNNQSAYTALYEHWKTPSVLCINVVIT